ncbi:MAG: hypothetical protein ACE361_26035, partial [Aureliella sp.]
MRTSGRLKPASDRTATKNTPPSEEARIGSAGRPNIRTERQSGPIKVESWEEILPVAQAPTLRKFLA